MLKDIDVSQVAKFKNPFFFCSFGKDSSSVLHVLWPYIDRIQVVFLDCGGLYPDIVQWLEKIGPKLPKFFHYRHAPPIEQDIKTKGFPLDLTIWEFDSAGWLMCPHPLSGKFKVRPWTDCVFERIWAPMQNMIAQANPDLIITGERKQDRPFADDWLRRNTGRTILRPIFDWSDQDVWDYIDHHRIPLAKSFQGRQKDRRDCWLCMGGHDFTIERMRELKGQWPELWNRLMYEYGFAELLPELVKLAKTKIKTLEQLSWLIRP